MLILSHIFYFSHKPATFAFLKFLLSISLFLLYASSTMGFVVQLHYCGGEVAAVKITLGDGNKANCTDGDVELEKTMTCCHNAHVSVQIDDERGMASMATISPKVNAAHLPILATYVVPQAQEALFIKLGYTDLPPPLLPLRTYLHNCCFKL